MSCRQAGVTQPRSPRVKRRCRSVVSVTSGHPRRRRRAGREVLRGRWAVPARQATPRHPQVRVPPRRHAASAGRRIRDFRRRSHAEFCGHYRRKSTRPRYMPAPDRDRCWPPPPRGTPSLLKCSAATNYDAVITSLVSEGWLGPSSAKMATAIAPYLEWLNTTAVQAEHAGAQANAAAAAYEAAFAATVPPPVVAANRTLLANLVASNTSARTPGRSRPPRPNTARCGLETPPR